MYAWREIIRVKPKTEGIFSERVHHFSIDDEIDPNNIGWSINSQTKLPLNLTASTVAKISG
jgi:hypothetical protein